VGSDKFSYIRNEIGAPPSAKEITVDSPFDFSKQALLVVPAGIPHPNAEEFMEAAVDSMKQAILACQGRTLGLFTSKKRLEYAYDRLSKELGYRVLMQGQAPVKELVRIFKEDTSSVLLGTNSLWTGVDVSGEALTCLIIDRIPFATPDDPVAIAIQNKLGDAAFFRYSVPSAIITFRQGFGRLIRSKTDKGVVVMLDNRIVEKGYGQRFTRALPRGLRVTRDVSEIGRFLAGGSHGTE
jgi:ATP-dependent DNA helicase DinG